MRRRSVGQALLELAALVAALALLAGGIAWWVVRDARGSAAPSAKQVAAPRAAPAGAGGARAGC